MPRLSYPVLCPHLHLKFLPPHLTYTTRTSPRLARPISSYHAPTHTVPTPMSRMQRNTPPSSSTPRNTPTTSSSHLTEVHEHERREKGDNTVLERYQPTSIAEMNAGRRSLVEVSHCHSEWSMAGVSGICSWNGVEVYGLKNVSRLGTGKDG